MSRAYLCSIFAVILLLSYGVDALITQRKHWIQHSLAHENQEHTVIFALKHKTGARAEGEKMLNAIHDPNHKKYGSHLSIQEMQEMFIDQGALRQVTNYLYKQHIEYVVRGDFIFATSHVAKWQDLLQTKFFYYDHIIKKSRVIRCPGYTIPNEVVGAVSVILLTRDLPAVQYPIVSRYTNTRDSTPLNPQDVYKLYGVPNNDLSGLSYAKGISHGVLSSNGGFVQSDLQLFKKNYGVAALGPVEVVSFQPYNSTYCQDPTVDCGEPSLDLEWINSMASGLRTVFFNSLADGLAESFNWMAHNSSAVNVFSISLGIGQPDQDYVNTLCGQAMMASLIGRTILAASGDDGAFNDDCSVQSSFPDICEYVVSVGGTQGPESGLPETEWFASGAGNTNEVPVPTWQKPLIKDYIAQLINLGVSYSALGSLNSSGRVYPDVAGVANSLYLYQHGTQSSAGGTSFATPIFAGILTHLNVLRAKNGLGTIGLLNLALASLNRQNLNPLNDITNGASQGSCGQNLPAVVGWDIGTGFGSPNFTKMAKILVPYKYSNDACANSTCAYPGGICTAKGNSYTCACDRGYTGDGFSCKANDECANKSNICALTGKLCVSTKFDYHCCVASPFFNASNFASSVTPIATTNDGSTPFRPKAVGSYIQLAATGAGDEASAVWSTDAICASFLTTSFYGRYRFYWNGDTGAAIDGTSFIFQSDGLNAIGGTAGDTAFDNGNITTGFAIKLMILGKSIVASTIQGGNQNDVTSSDFDFSPKTVYTVEVSYGPTRQTFSISGSGSNTVTTDFSVDLKSIFIGKQIVYIGAGAGTGGFSGDVFVQDIVIGDFCSANRCGSGRTYYCNSPLGAYSCVACTDSVQMNSNTFSQGTAVASGGSFKPTLSGDNILMSSSSHGMQSTALWYNTPLCLSSVYPSVYASFSFSVSSSTDGAAFVLQNQGPSVIGDDGGSKGVQGGNIMSAFSVMTSPYSNSVSLYIANRGRNYQTDLMSYTFAYNMLYTVEISNSASGGSVRITDSNGATKTASFTYDLSTLFGPSSYVWAGVTTGTGAAAADLFLKEFLVRQKR